MAARECNDKEKIFCERYVACMCPRTAALDAGYSLPTSRSRAYTWVSDREDKPHVYDYVQELLEAKRGKFNVTTQQVLHRLWLIASADPNELIELRRVNCRHCNGVDFEYQWREREYLKAVKAAERGGEELPDYAGGFGYDDTLDPVPECPECRGEGVERVIPKDTRNLSPSGRALFAGVEKTAQGLKVKTHDQLAALEKIGKHLGMFVDRKELAGPGGAALFPERIELVAPDVLSE